jgi:hypothetical protein
MTETPALAQQLRATVEHDMAHGFPPDHRVIEAAAALEAQAAQIAERDAQIEALLAFATDIMEAWPMGGIDGAELQDIAEKHGLLSPVTLTAPCHEECNCTDYGLTPEEWASGHICYRKTALLRGDAAMAAKEPR